MMEALTNGHSKFRGGGGGGGVNVKMDRSLEQGSYLSLVLKFVYTLILTYLRNKKKTTTKKQQQNFPK